MSLGSGDKIWDGHLENPYKQEGKSRVEAEWKQSGSRVIPYKGSQGVTTRDHYSEMCFPSASKRALSPGVTETAFLWLHGTSQRIPPTRKKPVHFHAFGMPT